MPSVAFCSLAEWNQPANCDASLSLFFHIIYIAYQLQHTDIRLISDNYSLVPLLQSPKCNSISSIVAVNLKSRRRNWNWNSESVNFCESRSGSRKQEEETESVNFCESRSRKQSSVSYYCQCHTYVTVFLYFVLASLAVLINIIMWRLDQLMKLY